VNITKPTLIHQASIKIKAFSRDLETGSLQ
jgi:hypothetical protein